MNEVNIGIIGGGSLGLLLSSYLANNHDVTLYVRRISQLENIQANGITLQLEEEPERNFDVNVELVNHLQHHDVFFITVKQPQIIDVIEQLRAVNPAGTIIFLQNGMGHIEKISTLQSPVYVGAVEHGASRISDNEVKHLGFGTIKLASFSGEIDDSIQLEKALHDDTFPFEVMHDWEVLLKSKLLINAVINPLTALFNVPNGSIVDNEYITRIAKKLTREAASVLHFSEEEAWENVKRVARNTSENTSSMRADILQNRETEIEAISGYLLGVVNDPERVPYTMFAYESILALQERGKLI